MHRQIILELQTTYPFGQLGSEAHNDEVLVIKKLPYYNSAQRETLRNKAQFLKLFSMHENIVGLLGYEETPGAIELIYEYIPYDFLTLLQKNSDYELAQARGVLANLTTLLEEVGIKSNMHQGTVGLDATGTVRYYLCIDDVPDNPPFHIFEHLEEGREEGVKYEEKAGEGEEGQYEEGNQYDEGERWDEKYQDENNRPMSQYDSPWISNLSHQSQSLQRTAESCYKMDDLLEKINHRLVELNKHRRKTTPSSSQIKQFHQQNQYLGSMSLSTPLILSQAPKPIQKSGHSPKPKSFSTISNSRLKYPPLSEGLYGEYESLKQQRKQMLDRIKVMIEKTDSILSSHKRRKSEEVDNI